MINYTDVNSENYTSHDSDNISWKVAQYIIFFFNTTAYQFSSLNTLIHPITLKYSNVDYEAKHQHDYSQWISRRVRIGAWLIIVEVLLGSSFGLLLSLPDLNNLWFIRSVVIGLVLVVWFWSYTRFFHRFHQMILSLLGIIGCMGISVVIASANTMEYAIYFCVILLAAFVPCIFAMRFIPSIITIVMILLVFNIVLISLSDLSILPLSTYNLCI